MYRPPVRTAGSVARVTPGESAEPFLSVPSIAPARIAHRATATIVVLILAGCAAVPDTPTSTPIVVRPADDDGVPNRMRLESPAANDYLAPAIVTAFSDAGLEAAFREAREVVALATGTQIDDVALELADDARIAREVRRETARLVGHQFDDARYAARFVDRVMRGQTGTYAALYASPSRTVMVSRALFADYGRSLAADESTRRAAVLALMIHELVHAADDRRFDIERGRSLDFRASFAESATFEGHAQWLTRRLCTELGCLAGLEALDAFMFGANGETDRLVQSSASLGRNVLEYSYVEGERFLTALAARPDGERLIERLLDEPPSDPIQILDPASYPDEARENRNRRLLDAGAARVQRWHGDSWARVETSPLKGVDMRRDAARRRAAIDGFTRLIIAMAALELHDQSRLDAKPIEITLLESDSAATGALFARTLHENSAVSGARVTMRTATTPAGHDIDLRHTATRLTAATDVSSNGGLWHRTLVADVGPWVVRIVASGEPPDALESYAIEVLDDLAADAGDQLSTNDR